MVYGCSFHPQIPDFLNVIAMRSCSFFLLCDIDQGKLGMDSTAFRTALNIVGVFEEDISDGPMDDNDD